MRASGPQPTGTRRAQPSGWPRPCSCPSLLPRLAFGTQIVYSKRDLYATRRGVPSWLSPVPPTSVPVQRPPARPGSDFGGPCAGSGVSWKKLLVSQQPRFALRPRPTTSPALAQASSARPATVVAAWSRLPIRWPLAPFRAPPHVCPRNFRISPKKSAKNCLSPARTPLGFGLARDSSPLHPQAHTGCERRCGPLAWRPTMPVPQPRQGSVQSAQLSRTPGSGTVRHCLPTGRPA